MGVGIGLLLGSLYLVSLGAIVKPADGPRPKGRLPGTYGPYTQAVIEASYQRRRLLIVGMIGLVAAIAIIALSLD